MINIVLVVTIWSWLWYHGRSIDKFSLQVLSIIYLPLLGASTFFSVLGFAGTPRNRVAVALASYVAWQE
jgi:hypothetical protein